MPESNWPYPRYLAHRGGGKLAPENTLAAFDVGRKRGYRAAEIDAVLSADGIAVLLHDATLERTTNGRGSVAAQTAAELALLDAGSWFGAQFAGTPLPTLEQALEHARAHGIWLNVEIKPVAGHEERTGEVVARCVAEFVARGPAPAPLLSSFSREALAAARAAAPGLPRGMLFTDVVPQWEEIVRALACDSVHCDHRGLTAPMARRIRDAGYGLLCYTVNEPQRVATLRSWGVDAICTDRIDIIDPRETVPAA